MDTLFQLDNGLRGFRLHKLEIYNWGTFDGVVYSVKPAGQTTLLVGENGSGKSTLIDAMLTLLVRPSARNYNVAAGAKRNERDERSYVKGAYDRTVTEDGRPVVQYLRGEPGHYTVLLACFRNERNGRAFTLCQVLYQTSDGSIEKVFAYSDGERSISRDLSGLTLSDGIAKTLREREFRTTSAYKQYFAWFERATGIRPKAMDVFNQTVAVKDVQRLDHFIRVHMLEAKPWGEKVGQLLNHFSELSDTHRVLLKARTQAQLLRPVIDAGNRFESQAAELEEAEAISAATELYFSRHTIDLLAPECEAWKARLEDTDRDIDRLSEAVAEHQRKVARLEVEIEQAGGARLRELPALIAQSEEMASIKQNQRREYEALLHDCGVELQVGSAEQLREVRAAVRQRRAIVKQTREEDRATYDKLQYAIGEREREIKAQRVELDALNRRKGNLPESFISIRDKLCKDLGLGNGEIPFAGELICVDPEQRSWESSIEMVLHSFARSLLVPSEHYGAVSEYVEKNRMVDAAGHGRKLVYLRVGSEQQPLEGPVPAAESLVHKLCYRDNHHLTPWVRAEIRRRFDYMGCETIEEFKRTASAAMTRNRHVKSGRQHHEKDDRSMPEDRRHFVLGWDNAQKRLDIERLIDDAQAKLSEMRDSSVDLNQRLDNATRVLRALEQCELMDDFDRIDHVRHEAEAQQLEIERRTLEESDDQIRVIRHQLANEKNQLVYKGDQRDALIAERTRLKRELKDGRTIIQAAEETVDSTSGDWAASREEELFVQIDERLGDQRLRLDNIVSLPESFRKEQAKIVEALRSRLVPVGKELTSAMVRFLKKFPDEKTDLDADIESLVSFRALHDRISTDDLPSYESRFKKRLNEKVLQELGMFRAALETERDEIRDKIEQLNRALRRLEYRPSTYMRLEPREVRDQEISDFRMELGECLQGSLELDSQVNEETFVRIESLVNRLRDAENTRWRDKVIDVRNWFDFAACELEEVTDAQRGYYEDSTGQSGGEKGKLAFTILVAAIAFQYDIDPESTTSDRFHFVMVDEMFSRADDHHAEYALELFKKFGLQVLIVAPLDAKARVTEPYVGTYLHVVKDRETNRSELLSMTATELQEATTESVLNHARSAK